MSKKIISTSGVSRLSVKRRVGLLVLLFLFAGAITYPAPANWLIDQFNAAIGTKIGHIEKPFVLGLDLQGGTRLEYEADVSNVPAGEHAAALEGVRDVIERRVNSMGVSEPVIQITRSGDSWRVSAELAGVKDINQAITMIGETPILEFKELNEDPPRELTDEEKTQIADSEKAAKEKAEQFLQKATADQGNFAKLVTENVDDVKLKENGGDLGFIKDNPIYQDLYTQIKDQEVGLVPKVIDTMGAEVVASIDEKKEVGTEVKASHILIQYVGAEQATASTTRSKEEALELINQIKSEATADNFTEKAQQYSEEPGAEISGGDLGWFGKGVMVQAFEDAAFGMENGSISEPIETAFGYHLIFREDSRPVDDIKVRAALFSKLQESDIIPQADEWKRTELTGKQLSKAQLDFDQRSGVAQVSLQFDKEGADLFADITKRNIGKPVAIFLDGEPISIPTVQGEIIGGNAVISGQFTVAEAKLLAQRLQAGALPVPINLIMQQSVGPTLGKTSVNASLTAGLWGFLLVALFMLIMYRLPGLVAMVALILYGTLSFAIFKSIPVTLTLSGIAGFILSVGMAVDANVLIFERLKEELKLKKTFSQALEEAFHRAWPSIRDGNVTTLISCVVLYGFTSSVIKGFALTLGIGILLSMFSAIVVTRNLLRLIATKQVVEKLGWLLFRTADKNNEQ